MKIFENPNKKEKNNKKEGESQDKSDNQQTDQEKQEKKKNPIGGGQQNFGWNNIVTGFLVLLLVAGLYSFYAQNQTEMETISVSEVAEGVKNGNVEKILVEGDELTVTYAEQEKKTSKKETGEALTQTLKNYGVSDAGLATVNIKIENPSGFGYWATNLAPFLIPLLFIGVLFWFISRQMKGSGGMQALSFGQSKAKIIDPDDQANRVLFKDVAGVKEAKEELQEIVDFLRNPKKFLRIGAQIPKGAMLLGGPGTGKTLLARAVAGEAGVPFFHLSGSDFVEMFVGVGASRVRDLFKMAKKSSPAIIFIDEIDAIGRVRGSGMGGGNDEREQTLNQILTEMDGFEPNEKVIVIAATNRPDVLDPALLRPGRFDRRVPIDAPDRDDRLQILRIHSEKKPFAEDADLEVIAERTPGFSGADLYSLMNEAAIIAARENRKKLSQIDLVRAIEKVMLGPERKSHLLTGREKEITAYHETGHALVASVLPYADPVHKITIISRGKAAGYTLTLPLEERKMQSQKEFKDEIAKALGGYVVEQMIFGDLTTGPSNDLQTATALARNMVTRYGMSEKMGPIALETSDGQAVYGRAPGEREYSEEVFADIDQEVSKIMNEGYERAQKVLTDYGDALEDITSVLVEKETLERPEYEELLRKHGIEPKQLEEENLEATVGSSETGSSQKSDKASEDDQGQGDEQENESDVHESDKKENDSSATDKKKK